MSYVIIAAVLWVLSFAIGTFILYKKYGSLKNAAFIRTFRMLGVMCIFFVLVVMLVVKALI
jgi:DMSO/TMAO reductase YedYZ heme-binding membrane subunit